MRRNRTLVIALGFTLLAVGCSGGGSEGSSLGPVPTGQPTGNVPPASPTAGGTASPTESGEAPTSTPTTSPDSVSITQGTASLVVTGDLQTSQPAIPLASPAIYAPPPGSFALSWQSAGDGFALAGPNFVGSRSTSNVMRLSFFVHASSGTYRFTSIDGGCSVTVVQPPDAVTFSGTFSCGSLVDDGGTITVAAQGAFLASG